LFGRLRAGYGALFLALAVVAGCRSDGVTIEPLTELGSPATAVPNAGGRATPPAPRPPALSVQAFRPEHGYTSMIADRRGVYWLGGSNPLQAVVLTAGLAGERERVLARPQRADEALGRPLPAGEWVVFPETQNTAGAGGPWRLRAIHTQSGRERVLDSARDGWEGLSVAASGGRVAYTVGFGADVDAASEVRVWDGGEEPPYPVLRTPPGVTLQRIAFDGVSAAAVRTTRLPDGTALTDVVELDLAAGQTYSLAAANATLPAIAPHWIAWVTIPLDGRPNQLVLYNRKLRTRRVIAEAGPGQSLHNPSITGDLITWNSTDTSEIKVYDALQRATFTLDRGSVGKVWAHDGVLTWTALNPATRQYEMRVGVLVADTP
jgi:hypothetical protein